MKPSILFCLLMTALTGHAQGIRFGQPSYGGNGCPAGTASIQVSALNSQIHIFTDAFTVDTGASSDHRIDRKSCNIAIPVEVPPGYQVALSNQVLGFVSAERGSSVQLHQEIFFAGGRGPVVDRSYTNMSDNFQLDGVLPTAGSWSPCGESTNLRVNLSLTAQGETFAAIDQMNLRTYWRRCR